MCSSMEQQDDASMRVYLEGCGWTVTPFELIGSPSPERWQHDNFPGEHFSIAVALILQLALANERSTVERVQDHIKLVRTRERLRESETRLQKITDRLAEVEQAAHLMLGEDLVQKVRAHRRQAKHYATALQEAERRAEYAEAEVRAHMENAHRHEAHVYSLMTSWLGVYNQCRNLGMAVDLQAGGRASVTNFITHLHQKAAEPCDNAAELKDLRKFERDCYAAGASANAPAVIAAWFAVRKHCLSLGMEADQAKSGRHEVIDFITALHKRANVSQSPYRISVVLGDRQEVTLQELYRAWACMQWLEDGRKKCAFVKVDATSPSIMLWSIPAVSDCQDRPVMDVIEDMIERNKPRLTAGMTTPTTERIKETGSGGPASS